MDHRRRDNQYVYDHLVTAANWAVDSYGATFIQRLDGYNTHIALGDADLQMIPFPFMQKLHPGAIIQTGMSDDSPDRLSFLVLHGDTKWFPMGDIWDSIKVPALICEFSGDGITYDGVSNSEWGHEYESETPPRRPAGMTAPPATATTSTIPPQP